MNRNRLGVACFIAFILIGCKQSGLPYRVSAEYPLGAFADVDRCLAGVLYLTVTHPRDSFFPELNQRGKVSEYTDNSSPRTMGPKRQIISVVSDSSGKVVAIAGQWSLGRSEDIRRFMEAYDSMTGQKRPPFDRIIVEKVRKSETSRETLIIIIRQ